MSQTLASRAGDIEALAREPLNFIAAEQGLLLGHSVHPAPRLREDHDADQCIPELRGSVPLHLWSVARERLLIGGGQRALERLDQWIAAEPEWAARAAEQGPGFALLPLHPRQARALADHPALARGRSLGLLRALGPAGPRFSATSSLRTLFADGSPWMLKTSLPIRLTNSLRTLSLVELERGVLLGRVLEDTEAAALERSHPQFRILREPAYFGLYDDAGQPGPRESFIALRDNPFHGDPPVEVLATLLQDHPITGRSRLALRIEQASARSGVGAGELARRWFASFTAVVLEPIIEAQAEFGLLLSAHQQNLMLGFADAGPLAGVEPRTAWFRDAQGTAYTDLAVRRFGDRLPEIADAQFASPLAERVWAYSVVINGVFNVIASLAMIPGVTVAALLEQLRLVLEAQRERGPHDRRGLDYLLDSPTLWTKANVFCFATGLDEVSLADPQQVYRPIANPLTNLSADTDRRDWHYAQASAPEDLGRVRTGQIDHPRRPPTPTGLLYRRHCPSIDRAFSLHAFDPDRDFDRFCRWMNDPVVARFWEQDWPRARLRERIDELLADPHVIPAIGWFDDEPFAYYEIYWAKEDRLGAHYAAGDYDRGFHMAVGEPEVRHRGWGRQWFLAMAHYCFLDDPRTQQLVGEPRIDQGRVRSWATTTAWEERGEIQFPHKRAMLMVLTRERFFADRGSDDRG